MTSPYPVELIDVTVSFGSGPREVTALKSVSLSVQPGELVAVMGPSGSGKSTLLNVAGLLLAPTVGRVLIDGASTEDMSSSKIAELRRKHIGFVFQHFNLVSTLSVGENVALPLELDGVDRRAALAKADEALVEVGLEGLGERFPDEISGGQAQRVAIARALVGTRSVVLADEPTGALDTTTADQVMAVLRSRIDTGAAGVLVTHEPRFASFADRVLMLRDGVLSGEGV